MGYWDWYLFIFIGLIAFAGAAEATRQSVPHKRANAGAASELGTWLFAALMASTFGAWFAVLAQNYIGGLS